MDDSYQTYLFTYRHDGADWVLPIKASSPEDAKGRLAKIAFARYDGVAVARIPIPQFSGIPRLLRWLFRA